ncbi:Phosphoglycerate mutase [Balamuthia mandrillaris]
MILQVWFVRHGQSESNLVGAIGRNNSSPLTSKGEEQAKKLGKYFKKHNIDFDYVFASVAVRAYDTARLACEAAGITTPITQREEIVEIHRGDCEGKTVQEVFVGKALERYRADPGNYRCNGGESELEVEERMVAFVNSEVLSLLEKKVSKEEQSSIRQDSEEQRKLEQYDDENEEDKGHIPVDPYDLQHKPSKKDPVIRVGIFSHGCAIRCFLRSVLGSDPSVLRFSLGNTAVSELHIDSQGGQWKVVSINRTVHLHD